MRLRDNLLTGRALALAGPVRGALSEALVLLGADVQPLPADALDEPELEAWITERAPVHGLVFDAVEAFDGGSEAALAAVLERAWAAVRGVAVGALIEGGAGGKLVLVAPAVDAGPLAGAAAAGLESLARTVAVEWARYGITATAVVPGSRAGQAELAELVCFLASPAGDYFSGCRFDLSGGSG